MSKRPLTQHGIPDNTVFVDTPLSNGKTVVDLLKNPEFCEAVDLAERAAQDGGQMVVDGEQRPAALKVMLHGAGRAARMHEAEQQKAKALKAKEKRGKELAKFTA